MKTFRYFSFTPVAISVLFLILATSYRVVQASHMEWPNFSPVMAVALGCGLYLRGVWRWLTPVLIQGVSDLSLHIIYGFPFSPAATMLMSFLYLFAVAVGKHFENRPAFFSRLSACIGCSILFYLVTNTVAWIGNLHYPQNFSGWLQALTTGLPGYPPTWLFFRNSLLSDAVYFCVLHFSVLSFSRVTAKDLQTVSTT